MTTRLHKFSYCLLVLTAGLLLSLNSAAQLFPVADVHSSNWSPEALTPNLEVEDNIFIISPYQSHATGEIVMSDNIEPGIYTLFTVRVLARKMPAPSDPGSAQRGLNINVRINGALIGIKEIANLTDTWTFYEFVYAGNFTHTELATLQVSFTTTGRITGQNLRQAQIDQIEVVLPSPAPLPVKLKMFNAQRRQTRVELNWITAAEQNNSGFELQRNAGNGSWQTIDFIPSQAKEGNSDSEISYQYSDANNEKVITQYRLKQIDRDNKFAYSAVRAVHGMSQSGRTLIVPNPGIGGQLNVLFENTTMRDLQLTDMVGRVLKQWNNYTDNSLHISSLRPGSYLLRIVDRESNLIKVEKILIGK